MEETNHGFDFSSQGGGVIVPESSPFDYFPVDCISNIISFTSPRDACVVASVSQTFESAAKSDIVWEKFIPAEFESLVTRSRNFPSKKDLYFSLCNDPILIDDRKKKADQCYGFTNKAITAVVGIVGQEASRRDICFDEDIDQRGMRNLVNPEERQDGWMEIELGEFFNLGGLMDSHEIEMGALETSRLDGKYGLIFQGIEIRPAKIQ